MNDLESKVDLIENTEGDENEDPIGSSPKDYKIMIDLLNELNEQYKSLKSFYEDYIKKSYNLDPKILNDILPITKADIEGMNIDAMIDFISDYHECGVDGVQNIYEMMAVTSDHPKDDFRDIIMDIKQSSMTIYTQKREMDHIRKESNKVLDEYMNYMSSDVVKKSRMTYLNNLKEAIKKESEEGKIKSMNKMISDIESSQNLSFIFDRFNKFGDKEVNTIADIFFSVHKSSYVMERFKSKISRFGYNENIIQHFLKLEETFLDDHYHPYNNLFLLIYVRMVGHADSYNKTDTLWVNSLTSRISDLIYHRSSPEDEASFIHILETVLDKFDACGWYDKFVKDNSTWEGHPDRATLDEQSIKTRKSVLTKKMEELGITGYENIENVVELQEYFESKLNELIDSQKDDFPSDVEKTDTIEKVEAVIDKINEKTEKNPE